MATVIEGIKFYTIPETAQALRVTPQTIRAWIKQGKIKSQRIGRPILITLLILFCLLSLLKINTTRDYCFLFCLFVRYNLIAQNLL